MDETDYIKEKYISDIEAELLPWIKKEGSALFEYNNWIPFRHEYSMTEMYLGYRKMFIYKEYVFQLSLVSDCSYNIRCNSRKFGNSIHFVASYYGRKEGNIIQPDEIFTLLEDNIIPEEYWYLERKYCTGR
jgi:hypothetical protein